MAIKYLQVEKCCFCVSLATGAKFFGFLSLTGSILLLFTACIYLIQMARFSPYRKPDVEEYVLIAIDLLVQTAQACVTTVLLLGIYQRKHKMMPYWLMTTPIVVLLELSILRNVTFQFFHVSFLSLEWIVINILTVFDDIYGWVIVYSYYQAILAPEAAVV